MSEIDPQDLEMSESFVRAWIGDPAIWSGRVTELAQALTTARQSGFRMGVEKAAEVVSVHRSNVWGDGPVQHPADEQLYESILSLIPSRTEQEVG